MSNDIAMMFLDDEDFPQNGRGWNGNGVWKNYTDVIKSMKPGVVRFGPLENRVVANRLATSIYSCQKRHSEGKWTIKNAIRNANGIIPKTDDEPVSLYVRKIVAGKEQ